MMSISLMKRPIIGLRRIDKTRGAWCVARGEAKHKAEIWLCRFLPQYSQVLIFRATRHTLRATYN
jgi:hypothetical protein